MAPWQDCPNYILHCMHACTYCAELVESITSCLLPDILAGEMKTHFKHVATYSTYLCGYVIVHVNNTTHTVQLM